MTGHSRKMLLAGAALSALLATGQAMAANGAASAAKSNDEPSVVQTLVVTAQRREEAIQDVPVAVSAFSADSLKNQQIQGGQDLLRAVPNVNFARGNFGGFNFQIRGIGTKTVGTSADGGISVHQNDVPLVASALGDGDFFDVERVEVLRGPQGTLFGRNATGGVVNIITNKPTERYQSEVTVDLGNYNSQRAQGYVNVPFSDTFAVRAAVNYLKRDGFATNTYLNKNEDNRDMWSGRLSAQWKPTERLRFNLMWEHSKENDNRDRVGKQLCIADAGKTSVGGVDTNAVTQNLLSQGCQNGSLYQPSAYGVFNSAATLAGIFSGGIGLSNPAVNGNAGGTTPNDWRKWQSAILPTFQRQGDLYEFKAEFDLTDSLTLISETSYATGRYFTRADYNRTIPTSGFTATGGLLGLATASGSSKVGAPVISGAGCGPIASGSVCVNDPQVGASNALRTLDVSSSTSRQFSEELRLQSSFKGPINFSGGVNFVSFKTRSDYYVLSNGLTGPVESLAALKDVGYPLDFGANPDGSGANYYDNRTDYRLGAYAAFGELYYKPTDDLKFTAGLRYGVDRKWDVGYGVKLLATPPYDATPQTVAFKEWTGRLNAEWTPHFSFTDKTLVYATYSRGYKPGGFNPAQSVGLGVNASFNPEFVDAIEIGTKNAILGGSMILNANVFHYDYTGYQISAIVNRNSVNSNIDAKVDGAEVEAIWEPIHRLRINGTLGYLHTDISNGSVADQLDLTGGDPSLTVVKDLTASNCTVKTADLAKIQGLINAKAAGDATATAVLKGVMGYLTDPDNKTKWPGIFPSENYLMTCSGVAAATGMFPKFTGGAITLSGYGQTGGVNVNLKGHELPNSPEVTINIGAQYEYHLGENWRITPRVDIYHQDTSYTRIFNTVHDQLKAYEVVNLSVLVQEPDWGLNIQAYVKNVFDKNYIQDSYLTDASSGLFTNIFIGDPRTYGVAVTKKF